MLVVDDASNREEKKKTHVDEMKNVSSTSWIINQKVPVSVPVSLSQGSKSTA